MAFRWRELLIKFILSPTAIKSVNYVMRNKKSINSLIILWFENVIEILCRLMVIYIAIAIQCTEIFDNRRV